MRAERIYKHRIRAEAFPTLPRGLSLFQRLDWSFLTFFPSDHERPASATVIGGPANRLFCETVKSINRIKQPYHARATQQWYIASPAFTPPVHRGHSATSGFPFAKGRSPSTLIASPRLRWESKKSAGQLRFSPPTTELPTLELTIAANLPGSQRKGPPTRRHVERGAVLQQRK